MLFKKDHYMVVDENDLTKIMKLLDKQVKNLNVSLCAWSSDDSKFNIRFDCLNRQWGELIETLKEFKNLVIIS